MTLLCHLFASSKSVSYIEYRVIMHAENFAGELTKLINRYSGSRVLNERYTIIDSFPLLPKNEIINITNKTLSVTLGTDVTSFYNYVNITPTSEQIINTPGAPVVQKSTYIKDIDDSDSSTVSTDENSKVDEVRWEQLSTAEKISEKSSSDVNIKRRSDTFVFEDNELNEGDLIKNVLNESLASKLKGLRKNAVEIVHKIDEMLKPKSSQNVNPIRRLSAFGTYTDSKRATIESQATQMPKIRRSFTSFPRTPTSSKLQDTLTVPQSLLKTKSASVESLQIQTKSDTKRATSISINNSDSNSLSTAKTRVNSEFVKNSKYAHIKSTIPKYRKK